MGTDERQQAIDTDADKDGVDLLEALMLAVEAVANHDWDLLLEPEASGDEVIIRIVREISTVRAALAAFRGEE